jgi:hypothetical protein
MSESEECPKCEAQLPPRFTSGRLVCTKCGWSDRPNTSKPEKESESTVENPPAAKVIAILEHVVTNQRRFTYGLGSLLLVIGLLMMLNGLFYDTSVSSSSEYSSSRIVNTGRVSDRETITNFGGFLSICGAIFFCRASNKQND